MFPCSEVPTVKLEQGTHCSEVVHPSTETSVWPRFHNPTLSSEPTDLHLHSFQKREILEKLYARYAYRLAPVLKTNYINVQNHILVASLTLMALF